jgi:hypothetical protein
MSGLSTSEQPLRSLHPCEGIDSQPRPACHRRGGAAPGSQSLARKPSTRPPAPPAKPSCRAVRLSAVGTNQVGYGEESLKPCCATCAPQLSGRRARHPQGPLQGPARGLLHHGTGPRYWMNRRCSVSSMQADSCDDNNAVHSCIVGLAVRIPCQPAAAGPCSASASCASPALS